MLNEITDLPNGGRIPAMHLSNTRDLGGLKTIDGRRILPCHLLRSGKLYQLCPEDISLLTDQYHLQTVIDLRTKKEQLNEPDTQISGVHIISNPILEDNWLGISRDKNLLDMLLDFDGDAEMYMEKCYRELVLNDHTQHHYSMFIHYILEQENGAILWHCSAGKDRAGIAAALLLTLLGVPQNTVLEDYMRTNFFLKDKLSGQLARMKIRGVSQKALSNIQTMLSVRESYLEGAFEAIHQQYQTMDSYFHTALGLTPEEIKALQDKYLF